MAGSNQYVDPVQVEVVGALGADVANDGALPPTAPPTGLAIMGLETATGFLFIPRVNAVGELIVVTAAPVPGATITSVADVAAAPAATVALGAPPAGTTEMTIQNTVAGSFFRVREVGGVAGSGILLLFGQARTFTEAIAALEIQNTGPIATAAAVQFQGP